MCGRGLWGVSWWGRGRGCGSERRLLLLATAGVFLSAARLLHRVLVVAAGKRKKTGSVKENRNLWRLFLNSTRTYRSFSCSFRASWFWAFSCLSRSSFSRAARRNCSKLSLEERTEEAGVDWDRWARLAQEPMFFSFTSWKERQNRERAAWLPSSSPPPGAHPHLGLLGSDGSFRLCFEFAVLLGRRCQV